MTMEEESYVPAQGVAVLSQFSTTETKAALDELTAKAIAAQLDKEHRLPGRNFAFDDRCVSLAQSFRRFSPADPDRHAGSSNASASTSTWRTFRRPRTSSRTSSTMKAAHSLSCRPRAR